VLELGGGAEVVVVVVVVVVLVVEVMGGGGVIVVAVVVGTAAAGVVAVAAGRFGYVCGSHAVHDPVSACSPVCGACAKVTTIRPSALYAGECSISGSTVSRNFCAGARPAGAPGRHGWSLPSSQGLGAIYDSSGVVLVDFRSFASCVSPTSSCLQSCEFVTPSK